MRNFLLAFLIFFTTLNLLKYWTVNPAAHFFIGWVMGGAHFYLLTLYNLYKYKAGTDATP